METPWYTDIYTEEISILGDSTIQDFTMKTPKQMSDTELYEELDTLGSNGCFCGIKPAGNCSNKCEDQQQYVALDAEWNERFIGTGRKPVLYGS